MLAKRAAVKIAIATFALVHVIKLRRSKKMGRKKTGNRYDTIKIPQGITAKIDEMIKASNHDFTSRTDVIKYAVRLLYPQYLGKKAKTLA